MSLIRLLSVGQSLRESKDRPGMYKLESNGAIPSFEDGRQLPLQMPAKSAGSTEAVKWSTSFDTGFFARPAKSNKVWFQAHGTAWATMISRIFGGTSTRRPVRATQAELSLDSVKVVRNDLSDTDIEVVPRAARPAQTIPMAEKREVSGWMRLTQRLFRAHKDPFSNEPAPSASRSDSHQRELIART